MIERLRVWYWALRLYWAGYEWRVSWRVARDGRIRQ